jgi:RHS repeat-associated protein
VSRSATLAPETQWNYDAVGNVTSVVRPGAAPGERITAYKYDAANRVIRTIEGSDNANADLAGTTDVDGGRNIRSGIDYDADGHVVAQFEPRAFASSTTPDRRYMVRTDYDVDGRPVAQWVPRYDSNPNGGVTDLSADGNQQTECPEISATYPQHKPQDIKQLNGLPRTDLDFANGVSICLSRVQYDNAGRVSKVYLPTTVWNRSPSGPTMPANELRTITYAYTGDNLIATETGPSPRPGETAEPTRYSYNGAGQPVRVVRPNGATDLTEYSADGLVTKTTGASGEVPHVQTFQYDSAGNRIKAGRTVGTDAEADTWTYTADNLVAEYVQGVAHNSSGTQISAGNRTSYEYDLVGNPVRVYSPAANACSTATVQGTNCDIPGTRGHPTRYTYTLDNLVATTTVPVESDGSKKRETTYSYDLGGRKVEQAVAEIGGTDGVFVAASATDPPPTTTSVEFFEITRPANVQPNDVMLASIVVNDSSPVPVMPAGWSEVRTDSISGSLRQTIYRRTADPTDTPGKVYRWTLSSGRRVTGGLHAYRGVSTTDPIVDNGATVDTTADAEVIAPSISAVRSGVLVHFAAVNGEGTITAPLGMYRRWHGASYNPSDNRDVRAAASEMVVDHDGATGSRTAITSASGGHIGAVVSLRPAVPGTPDAGPSGISLVNKSSNTSGSTAAGSITITRPAGTTAGDLMVAQIVSNDDSPDFGAPTTPGPWTLVRSDIIGSTLRQSIYVRVATAADETTASYSWTVSSTRRLAGGIATYHGVDTTNLAGLVHDETIDTTSGTAVTTPSISAAANSRLLQFSAVAAEGTFTAPAGMAELWDQAAINPTNTRDVVAATFDTAQTSQGPTGPRTATASNPGKRIGVLLALTPEEEETFSAAAVEGSSSQRFEYYPNDRLKDEFGRNDGEQIHHRYDAAGNPIEDTDVASTHKVTSSYYLDGLPRSVSSGIGANLDTTEYGYNGLGLPISRQQGGTQAQTTRYGYNDAALIDQLASNTDAANIWTWKYDVAGRPIEESAPGGHKVTKAWRSDDTLDSQELKNTSGTIIAKWTYHFDALYRQTSQGFTGRDSAGAQTNKDFAYSYWATGELKTFNDGTNTHNLTWDPNGNRLTFGTTLSAKYNADDSIDQTVIGGMTTNYEYLPFGGVLRDGACNTYDGFDRLTSIRPADADIGAAGCEGTPLPNTVAYAYDALDRQRSRTVSGSTTSFSYEGQATAVVAEKTGSTVTSYLTAPNGDPVGVKQSTGSETEFLFDDGAGNVATITTASTGNAVKCAVRYNPFGEPFSPQGTSNPCYAGSTASKEFFRGEHRDDTTGRYQLGSRTYDPKTSSFLTPDGYRTGSSDQSLSVGIDPLTRNSYSYVNGDPINLMDPDGHVAYPGNHNYATTLDGGHPPGAFTTTTKTKNGNETVLFSENGIAIQATQRRFVAGFGMQDVDTTSDWLKRHGTDADRAMHDFLGDCPYKLASCRAADNLISSGDVEGSRQLESDLCKQSSEYCSFGAAQRDRTSETIIDNLLMTGSTLAGGAAVGRLAAAGQAATSGKAATGGIGPVLRGQAGVDQSIAAAEARGRTIVGREITMETTAGRTRVDILARDAYGNLEFIESKNGPYARLTPNQRAAFPLLEKYGGIPRGRRALEAGLAPGKMTGPIPVRVDWWNLP